MTYGVVGVGVIDWQVFFDVEVDGKEEGRLLMQLRSDVVPKTAENFRQVKELGLSF